MRYSNVVGEVDEQHAAGEAQAADYTRFLCKPGVF